MTAPLSTNVRGADPRNYGIAKRASLWTRPLGSTNEADWDEIGNLADLQALPDLTKLEHESNRRGDLVRDRIEYIKRKMTLDIKLDEIKTSNLLKAFGSSIGKSTSSATVRDGKVQTNPGAGGSISFGMLALLSLIARSVNEEGVVTTFVADPLATATGDVTAGGSFNNTTDPVVVVAATYPGTPTAVGSFIKIGSEILRVTDFSGGNLTLARAQLGTVAAAHINGGAIFKDAGATDYVVNLATGAIGILPGGALADASMVPEVHLQVAKSVATEAFQMFDGTPVKLQASYQVLTSKGARIVMDLPNCVITPKGAITFGLGDKWIEAPLELDVLADANGSLGTFHVIDAAETV